MSDGAVSYSVLVADDSADSRLMMRLAFDRTDDLKVVAEAADGLEAIDLVALHHPDFALVDLTMPHLDGLDAIARICDASPETCVVVLSGRSELEMRDAVLAAGARDYIEKAVSVSAIADRLRALHDGQGL